MSLPLWVSERAGEFWAAVGEEESFPRNLRLPIAVSLPLTVVLLPKLRVTGIDTWLRQQGVICAMATQDRAVRACLIARYGQGLVFVDGSDPEDEVRFSLAHELAHFLRDYRRPRLIASERLGPEVLDVLDGVRPPRQDERVQALLARVPIGFHVHLMERTNAGTFASAAIEKAERDADLLAFELLAPSARILDQAEEFPDMQRNESIVRLLTASYGLPVSVAAQYASILLPPPRQTASFISRLRQVT